MPVVMFVDGSLASSGIAIGNVAFKRIPQVLHLEKLKTRTKDPLEKRLAIIYQQACQLIKDYKVEQMIMENKHVAKGIAIPTALKIGQADAAFKIAAGMVGIPVGTFEPSTIKLTVTGFARAEKEQVEKIIVQLFKDQEIVLKKIKPEYIGKKGAPKIDDMADAVGGLYTYSMIPERIGVA